MVVNILSAVPLLVGVIGFVSHARRREKADEEYLNSESTLD